MVLEVRGLRKAYGNVTALDGIDLEIAPGEVCGLLGPNGAGKTTLVSIVAGLRRADGGQVTVNGVDALARPFEARRNLGLAPQELGIYPTLTVRDNLVFFGELAELRGALLAQRVRQIAEVMGLGDFLERRAKTLSGGEKRRLHTAAAMMHRPPLLMLDEPTSGADVQSRSAVLAVVQEMADNGVAVCYSTHYLQEVEALRASVAIIDRGKVIARGSVAELVARLGGPAIELRFDAEPPALRVDRRVERGERTLRVFTDRPAVDAARILAGLGDDAARLQEIEFITPSLESVFLALTGRRYTSGSEQRRGGHDVVAS